MPERNRDSTVFEIGEVIRRLRKRKGWSQLELAKKVGLAVSTVSRIEKGDYSIDWSQINLFAGAFDISAFQLVWLAKREGLVDGDPVRDVLDRLITEIG